MTELLPLLAGAGPVASVLIGMLVAHKITEAARQNALDRYKLTAEEADEQKKESEVRLSKVETALDAMRTEFADCVRKLGQAIAEVEMSKIREKRLADRIAQLEKLSDKKESP